MHAYQAKIAISKQEDGLWRLSVPGMKGAWVDAPTLEEGFAEVQEAIALMIRYYQERGWALPEAIRSCLEAPAEASIPVVLDEYQIAAR